MKLYIDIDRRVLVDSAISNRQSSSKPVFYQGDTEVVEICLLKNWVSATSSYTTLALDNTYTLRAAIGVYGNNGNTYYSYADNASFSDGNASIRLPLDTDALNAALGGESSLTATFEIELTDPSGYVMTVLNTQCTVKNDLIDGATVPLPPIAIPSTGLIMTDANTGQRWRLVIRGGLPQLEPVSD